MKEPYRHFYIVGCENSDRIVSERINVRTTSAEDAGVVALKFLALKGRTDLTVAYTVCPFTREIGATWLELVDGEYIETTTGPRGETVMLQKLWAAA